MSPAVRLYYRDATLRIFDAIVRSCVPHRDSFEVVLDQTAFYPTSGGQPFDTGKLGGVAVLDVVERDDGEIVHVVAGALEPGDRVSGEIDWGRRFDHMQQHTGQHILSAAFDRMHGVGTVGFHLGKDLSTIDLSRELATGEIAACESEANRIVWEDRPVQVRFVGADEAARLPLRKEPVRAGELRIVEVDAFDLSACGGTHVARTGMVGNIAVTAWERFKGGLRISFACGRRALDAHRRLRDVVSTAGRTLSVTAAELNDHITRLQAQTRTLQHDNGELQLQLARYRAAEFCREAETAGPYRVVLRAEPSTDAAALRALAQSVVREPALVAVLVGSGNPAPVVVARSPGLELDAGVLLKEALTAFGGRGGGKPDLAQGGVSAAPGEIVAFLRQRLIS